MKLSKLLVLSALWLGLASSVSAAIVDGVRQKPVPQTTGFVASTAEDFQTNYYYLYNVDAGLFFTEGNAWGTQVSLSTSGLKAAFTPDGDYPLAYQHIFTIFSNSNAPPNRSSAVPMVTWIRPSPSSFNSFRSS